MSGMFKANCIVVGLYLWAVHGGTIFWKRKAGKRICHIMLLSKDGKVRHFKETRSLLPGLLGYFYFEGKIETISLRTAKRAGFIR